MKFHRLLHWFTARWEFDYQCGEPYPFRYEHIECTVCGMKDLYKPSTQTYPPLAGHVCRESLLGIDPKQRLIEIMGAQRKE